MFDAQTAVQTATQTSTGFVDAKTIGAFAGATAAVFAATAVVRRVFGYSKPWVPFLLSVIVSFALAQASKALGPPLDWVVAVANACLLFCAVVGVNEGAENIKNPPPAGKGQQQGAAPKMFIGSLFRRHPPE
jgi:hypothetical protein